MGRDLSKKNADKMRNAIAPCLVAGAKIGRGGVIPTSSGRSTRSQGAPGIDREQNKAIRAWAKNERKDISDRGRIPQDIVDQYHAKAGR
ncbi:Lsr2 family protein [Asanoa sp. NPDC049573]|uniref:histone-like nucleoid-structuring protein Lsr2 n=1 Tax=Asanoa sp. NPDC049573 TaxID=3155396 RepID=UPI00341C5B2F